MTLGAWGVTDAERERLAALYPAGKTLWRMLLPHFTDPWDYNWPYGLPDGSRSPEQPQPADNQPQPESCEWRGSIIDCQNQLLGEVLGLAGTPFRLHYRSDRVLGHTQSRTLKIPLSGDTVPPVLGGIELEINVAGRRITQCFPATPRQTTTFTWDGLDGYERPVQGQQPVTIRIGYVYRPFYYGTRPAFSRSFGSAGGGSGGVQLSGLRTSEITVWQTHSTTVVSAWDARPPKRGSGTPTPSPSGQTAASSLPTPTTTASAASARTGSSPPWPGTAVSMVATSGRPPRPDSPSRRASPSARTAASTLRSTRARSRRPSSPWRSCRTLPPHDRGVSLRAGDDVQCDRGRALPCCYCWILLTWGKRSKSPSKLAISVTFMRSIWATRRTSVKSTPWLAVLHRSRARW